MAINGRTEIYRELLATKKRHERELMRKEGVLGVGVGRDELIVFIERERVVDPTIPKEIEGKRVRLLKSERFEFL